MEVLVISASDERGERIDCWQSMSGCELVNQPGIAAVEVFCVLRGHACLVSRRSDRDGTDEVTLADLDAAVAEDVVGGGDVKIEVWQREVMEVVRPFHVALNTLAKRENDLAVGGVVDLFCVERLHKGDCLRNARLEFCDRLLVVLILGRVCVSKPCTAVLRLVAGDLHLLCEGEHVGEEARVEKHSRVDALRLGIGLGLVEERRERVETDLEYRN
jgi:hypothetical protein